MLLPYSWDVYLDVMSAYNADWFPLPLLATLLALALTGQLFRNPRSPVTLKITVVFLIVSWGWVGWGFQWQVMTSLDFSAPLYAMGWGLQAVILAWLLRHAWRASPPEPVQPPSKAGLSLALFGLIGYPLIYGLVSGNWHAIPLVGFMPDTTALVTVGLLLLWPQRVPLWCFVIPLGWGFVALVSGYLLGHLLGYIVIAALGLGLGWGLAFRLRADT